MTSFTAFSRADKRTDIRKNRRTGNGKTNGSKSVRTNTFSFYCRSVRIQPAIRKLKYTLLCRNVNIQVVTELSPVHTTYYYNAKKWFTIFFSPGKP